jgi:hypothetical protein
VVPRLIAPLPGLDRRFRLTERGYTIFIQEHEPAERRRLTLHIAAGEQIE